MASYFVNDKWYSAAKIIRAEIRERKYDSKSYDIANVDKGKEWIRHHLQTFLKIIVQSELKQNSIGHSIIKSARPRSVITPTLFGISVEMDYIWVKVAYK